MASIHKHRDKYQVRVRRQDFLTLTGTFHRLSDAKERATLQKRQADTYGRRSRRDDIARHQCPHHDDLKERQTRQPAAPQ